MKSFAIEYIHPVNERLMAIWGTIAGHKLSIIVAYAPTVCSASSAIDTAKFYAELHMLITTVIPSIYRDKCIILGDFNARTGGLQDIDDNYNVLGPYITDDPEKLPYNANGERLVKFCKDHSFRIGNSLYESTAAEGSATWGTTKIHSTTPQHMGILDARTGPKGHTNGNHYNQQNVQFFVTIDYILISETFIPLTQHCQVDTTQPPLPTDHKLLLLQLTLPVVIDTDVPLMPTSHVRTKERLTKYYVTSIRHNDDIRAKIQTKLAYMFNRDAPHNDPSTADEQLHNIMTIRSSVCDEYVTNEVPKKKTYHKSWFEENNKAIHTLLRNKQRAYANMQKQTTSKKI